MTFLILMIILQIPRKAPWCRRLGKEAGRSLLPCVQAFFPVPESELTTTWYLTFQESLETKGMECMLGHEGAEQRDWCPLPLRPGALEFTKRHCKGPRVLAQLQSQCGQAVSASKESTNPSLHMKWLAFWIICKWFLAFFLSKMENKEFRFKHMVKLFWSRQMFMAWVLWPALD